MKSETIFSRSFMHYRYHLAGFLLTLAATLGVIFGLGGYTFYYGQGFSYFSKDPTACVNCHIMQPQYDSWQNASHHAVATCVDCHLPNDFLGKWIAKAENGYFHSKGFTLQDFDEPILIKDKNARILQNNCISCHQETVHALLNTTSHTEQNDMQCVHCQRSAGHGDSTGLGGYDPNLLATRTEM